MRSLVAALLLLTACGGGGGGGDAEPPDAAQWLCDGGFLRCTPQLGCNPLENTGCDADEKCSWVVFDSDNDLGTNSCVPDGAIGLGEACVWGPDGELTGYDDCASPGVCIDGYCEEICSLSLDSCPDGYGCLLHVGTFTGLTPALGACRRRCDPVAQDCTVGACYGGFDERFLCEQVLDEVAAAPDSFSQEDPALAFASGEARPNGCTPGFAPLLPSSDLSQPPTLCSAYCSPVPTSAESPAGDGGAPPHTCADRGASTQECRYFWALEDTAGGAPQHP